MSSGIVQECAYLIQLSEMRLHSDTAAVETVGSDRMTRVTELNHTNDCLTPRTMHT